MRFFAVMLGVLGWAGSATAAEPCDGAAVEVATLNTWGLPYPLSRARRSRFGAIEDFVDSGFDVVGLQEVWQSARGFLLHDLRLPTAKGDSGLAVVTPYASTRPRLSRFETARGVDRWKAKGVLSTRVALPSGERTWVVVTHMQAGESERAAAVRASQVDQLLDVVNGLDGPAIVMGDFNLYPELAEDRASTRRMAAVGWTDAGAEGPTYPGTDARLDRIYVRGEVEVVEASVGRARGLSDHRPVRAAVKLCSAE